MSIVEITQSGMDHWDARVLPPLAVGAKIRVKDHEDEEAHGLFLLGLAYGAGPQDTKDITVANPKWRRIIANLVEAGYFSVTSEI